MKMNQFVTVCAMLAVGAVFLSNYHGASPPPDCGCDTGSNNIVAQHGASPPPDCGCDTGSNNIVAQRDTNAVNAPV
jgi:hypothetical protein